MNFVDSLDSTTHQAQPSSYECRRVSRTWCRVVDDAVARGLPPMPSESLAALLRPGKLRFVLLSCRYLSQDHHDASHAIVYNNLVSRAEACSTRLHETFLAANTSSSQGEVQAIRPSSLRASGEDDIINSGSAAITAGGGAGSDGGSGMIVTRNDGIRAVNCWRVALMRIVYQALKSPAFSWCSTLSAEDSRLLEGCVGACSLLNARWFAI